MNNDFPRIKRLPPYVFNITNELKMAARHRGEDIIDLSMGNPDGDTPKHIVDKMVEVAQRPGTHGYSASRGIPRLRKAISDWYKMSAASAWVRASISSANSKELLRKRLRNPNL